MNIQELKDAIDNAPNKEIFQVQPNFYQGEDIFAIVSAKYKNYIYCPSPQCANDLYDYIRLHNLDEKPFAMDVLLMEYNENTIDIINSLSEDIFVRISPSRDISLEDVDFFGKISHTYSEIDLTKHPISIQCLEWFANNFNIDDTRLLIEFDSFDDNAIETFGRFYEKNTNLICFIDINNSNSLKCFNNLVNRWPACNWQVRLATNLFDYRNSDNARSLLLEDLNWSKLENDFSSISYLDMECKSMEEIFMLEKLVEQIKSHIPTEASELDIVTYVSLFIANYFKFDYKYSRIEPDLNSRQFITFGKGVCRHFSAFTKYILNSLGIVCLDVHAISYKDKAAGHAFNVVKINGREYFLDNTWLAEKIQSKSVRSLSQASDFLTSEEYFKHEEYMDTIKYFLCEQYDRDEIDKSVDRVLSWGPNYIVHRSALKDLFNKYILKKTRSIEEKIEDAIPRRF